MTPLEPVENVGSPRQSPMSAISFSLRWLLTTSLLTSLMGDGKNWTCVSHLRTFPKERPFCISTNLMRIDHSISSPYPSYLLKKDIEVNSLSLLSEHWFAFSKRPHCFPNFQTMSTNHNGWCKMSESNCSSCSQNKGATITFHPAYYTPQAGIEPTTPD